MVTEVESHLAEPAEKSRYCRFLASEDLLLVSLGGGAEQLLVTELDRTPVHVRKFAGRPIGQRPPRRTARCSASSTASCSPTFSPRSLELCTLAAP